MKTIAYILSFITCLTGQGQNAWTVDECMQYAVMHNHEVRLQNIRFDDYKAEKVRVIGSFLPAAEGHIGGQYNFGRAIDPETNKPAAEVIIKKAYGTKASKDATPEISPNVEDATGVTYHWADDNKTLVVEHFNFNDNYIANTHPGYELQVTIKGITPKDNKTGDELASNESTSGIYSKETDGEMLKAFEIPAISRHKYTLTVGGDNTNATVNSRFSIKQDDGTTELSSDDLEKAIVELNGIRSKLNEASIAWSEVGPSYTMYLENLPLNSKISNTMSIANDSTNAYTYSLVATEGEATILDANLSNNAFTVNYADTDYEITSEPNTCSATLSLKTEGEFANTQRKFPIGQGV